MELRQLEYFVAVAEEESFTKAAARVRVAQSGVSAQIRRLERELGQPLLDRAGHTVRLTEVGVAVLAYAREALSAVAGARGVVEEYVGLLCGHVTIGMVTSSWLGFDLPGLLTGFRRRHPAVEVELSEATSDRLTEELRCGQLDAAIIAPTDVTPPGLTMRIVADEQLVAAVGQDDELAASATIPLAALRDRQLISVPRSVGWRVAFDDACALAGFEPRMGIEASDPSVLAELAVSGLGVAVLPLAHAAARQPALRILDVTNPCLRARIALAWSATRSLSPATRALVEYARTSLGKPVPTFRVV